LTKNTQAQIHKVKTNPQSQNKTQYCQSVKAKTKSKKQVGYLLSKGSPLTYKEQTKLKKELHSGKVKIKKSK